MYFCAAVDFTVLVTLCCIAAKGYKTCNLIVFFIRERNGGIRCAEGKTKMHLLHGSVLISCTHVQAVIMRAKIEVP